MHSVELEDIRGILPRLWVVEPTGADVGVLPSMGDSWSELFGGKVDGEKPFDIGVRPSTMEVGRGASL